MIEEKPDVYVSETAAADDLMTGSGEVPCSL